MNRLILKENEAPWRIKWRNAGNIKFPEPQYDKMKKVKDAMGCKEWADLADELYELIPVLQKRRKVYKA